jgi:hypothetical protein
MSEFAQHMLLFDKMIREMDCAHVSNNRAYFVVLRYLYASAIIAGQYY